MIPYSNCDISLPWLNEVLSEQFNSRIKGFTSEIIGGGAGVLGELARLTLHYEEQTNAPDTLIAKFSSPVAEARAVAGSMSFYKNEHLFYQSLVSEVPIHTPISYYQSYSPEDQEFVLLMSDIEGEVVDQVQGCSLKKAEIAIDELAKLHAWGYRQNRAEKVSWLRSLTNEEFTTAAVDAVKANASITVEKLSDIAPDWLKELAPDFHKSLPGYMENIQQDMTTLLHGDFRADNLIFNLSQLTTIDWQILLKGPGAYDLAYFLSQSLDISDRREHGETLINRYLDNMNQLGIQLDRSTFDDAFKATLVSSLVYPLVAGGIIDESFPRSKQLVVAMLSRSCAAIEDYDCFRYF